MSDAPDQIWIDRNGGNWSPCSGGTQDVEYRRADLPPTLSAAMELPEVKALKDERDAATAAYWRVRSYAVHDDDCTINRYPNRNACSCGLRNALAAIKETKT